MKSNKLYTRRRFVGTTIGALVAANLAACGGGSSAPPATPPAAAPDAPQTINLSANASRIVGAKPVTLTATLGRGADVTWALGAGSPGTLSATTGTSVTYTPPATAVGAATPVAITATSAGVTATAKLALMPDPRQATGLALLAGALGGNGLIDGQGTAARFMEIAAMDVDRSGNLVVADLNYSADGHQFAVIRVVGPSGNVLTATPLASLSYGHADGAAATAQTGKVSGLAAAPNGDIYFVDNDGGARLRVLRGGQITTLQSNLAASRVVIDRNGNIYLYNDAQVLRVSADGGSATVLAGDATPAAQADGQGTAARFQEITDATTDASGNLYVTDRNTVRRITPAGAVTTVAGSADDTYDTYVSVDGDATTARFGRLLSLSMDNNGNLLVLQYYFAGEEGYLVRQVTPAGVTSTVYTSTQTRTFDLWWWRPPGIATLVTMLRFNRALNGVQLARRGQIDQLTAGAVQAFAGFEGDTYRDVDGVGAAARFVSPSALAADLRGNVYTVDIYPPASPGALQEPSGLWLRKIAVDGTVTTVVADGTLGIMPNAIVADADGNVFVSGRRPGDVRTHPTNGALYKVDTDGKVALFAGSLTSDDGDADGTGGAARFIWPVLEGIDIGGNLYVSGNGKFRKVTPQAVVTTVAALPAGLKAAPNGLVYTSDTRRNIIEATDATGNKTVVAGVDGVPGTRLGALPGGLEQPRGIVPTGPNSFAVLSGAAILRLLLP